MLQFTHDEYDDLSVPMQRAVDAMIARAIADGGMVSCVTEDGKYEICASPRAGGGTAFWVNAARLGWANWKRGTRYSADASPCSEER